APLTASPSRWLGLIARLSPQRVGRRYTRRGADKRGEVANEVETEQLLWGPEGVAAHVQLRGSVPVRWAQPSTLAWEPPIVLNPDQARHAEAASAHFARLLKNWDKVAIVSLLKHTGSEAPLGGTYERNVKALQEKG